MTINRINWLSLLVLIGMVLAAAGYYSVLPDPVPSHWNAAGEVDDWVAKPWGVWLMPLITGFLWLMFAVLPVISPKGFRLDAARRAYDIIWFIMMVFMGAVQLLTYQAALNQGPSIELVVPMLVGLLFIVLGNYMGKFPRNFWVGIRTPWTLASEEVWNRTHRLGGWVFMIAGFLLALTAFVPGSLNAFIVIIAGVALVPIIYSLVLYRRLHGFRQEP